jgi:hypothetical protein
LPAVALNLRVRSELEKLSGSEGLNNQRLNLRLVTPLENSRNIKIKADSVSGYKGVACFENKKWRAMIRVDKKLAHIGLFTDPKEAAGAYNKAALKYLGEFAKLNNLIS